MKVLETGRLVLRWLTADDAAFIFRLVNDPTWIRYIGDKGVRTLEDAQRYIEEGPGEMYSRLGHGLYLVEIKGSGEPAGICGLIRRESLKDVDLGFAFLPEFRGRGYAFESASAVMIHEARALGLSRSRPSRRLTTMRRPSYWKSWVSASSGWPGSRPTRQKSGCMWRMTFRLPPVTRHRAFSLDACPVVG